jgi:hypothetical protein
MQWRKVFAILAFVGFLLTVLELSLSFSHESICHTEGCRLVASQVRFGDWTILTAGALAFASLFWLSVVEVCVGKSSKIPGSLIDLILIVSLAGEGFFTGYQVFRIHKPCAFCLTVFALFVVLSILRVLAGHKRPLIGFACFACVFAQMYFIMPAAGSICLPQDKQLILFYEKGCSHCKSVLNECRQCNIQVYPLPAGKYQALLKGLGIDEVPVLLVNDRGEKKILIGEAKIKAYLKALAVGEDKAFSMGLEKLKSLLIPSANAGTNAEGACKIGKGCDQ